MFKERQSHLFHISLVAWLHHYMIVILSFVNFIELLLIRKYGGIIKHSGIFFWGVYVGFLNQKSIDYFLVFPFWEGFVRVVSSHETISLIFLVVPNLL